MSEKTIQIAQDVALPLNAVTQTIAAIGSKGAGKTYLASMIAEQMLDAQAQVIVLDPVGVWWGLRVDEDGRSPGKHILVIGGPHGDVPISMGAGGRTAKLLCDSQYSAVLDLSEFRQGERKTFVADFAEEFFQLKKSRRTAVHLFVEEAQVFIPQHPQKDETRMLGAFEQIVRLGRNYGIGITMITQRPQSVNKECLNMTECLCVLQVAGPHERKALDGWIQEHGADRSITGRLPSLARGEGYVWSPRWLQIFKRVRFLKKTTFDASSTPEVGAVAVSAQKARSGEWDVSAIALLLAEPEKPGKAKGKKDAARIAELETENASLRQTLADYNRIARELASISNAEVQFLTSGTKVEKVAETVPVQAEPVPSVIMRLTTDLTSPEQRIVDSIAWLQDLGFLSPLQTAVAFFAGYSITSTSYTNPRGALKQRGLVEYLNGGRITLTAQGMHFLTQKTLPRNSSDIQSSVLNRLANPERKILLKLLESDSAHATSAVAISAGYSPTSTSFTNPRGRLKSLGFISYPSAGYLQADSVFFKKNFRKD